jgi:hypothetical protein
MHGLVCAVPGQCSAEIRSSKAAHIRVFTKRGIHQLKDGSSLRAEIVSRTEFLSDAQWAFTQSLVPSFGKQGGRPFRNNRRVVRQDGFHERTRRPAPGGRDSRRRPGLIHAGLRPARPQGATAAPRSVAPRVCRRLSNL